MSRDPRSLLEDIERSCAKAVRYSEGRARDDVFSDDIRFDAILLNLHIIGEAVKQLPMELRSRYSSVPWREIAGLRDFIAHAYFSLDLEIIWDAIQNDVPKLLDRVQEILAEEPASPSD